MSKIFRQNSSVSCFYCQTTVIPLPRNPRSFRCPECECWNRYDSNGEIISDEPAMYDENLNARSFARRASPRKDRLPTAYGRGLFCHSCQTNQMLLANLLSNYLPPPGDPEYEQRAETLPEYRQSIEVRYPPVCADCAPAVEEELRKRNEMARTSALGGFLRASNGVHHQVTQAQRDKDRLAREIAIWKVRGVLWAGSLLCTLTGNIAVALGLSLFRIPDGVKPIIAVIAFVSLLWTAWDPTYASLRRAKFQGRARRLRGKKEYNILQFSAWLSRFATSLTLVASWLGFPWDSVHLWESPLSFRTRMYCSTCALLEILILIRSWFVLRLEQPPPVRLITDTSENKRSFIPPISPPTSRSTTPAIEPDLLAPLTLSSKPMMVPSATASTGNPIFGVPSLAATVHPHVDSLSLSGADSSTAMDIEYDDDDSSSAHDPDAMDWSPIHPSTSSSRTNSRIPNGQRLPNRNDDSAWLRPQRFFAPEEPTGLENLFANTVRLVDDDQAGRRAHASAQSKGSERLSRLAKRWVWLAALCMIPLGGVMFKVWERNKGSRVFAG